MISKRISKIVGSAAIITIMISSCSSSYLTQVVESSSTLQRLDFTPTSNFEPFGVSIDSFVPEKLRSQFDNIVVPEDGFLSVRLNPSIEVDSDVQWVYLLAAPFPTVVDGVTYEQLRSNWNGESLDSPFEGIPLLMSESTLEVFSALWGVPAQGSVRIVPDDQLLDTAWGTSLSWVIIPFESIEPHWKILTVDGQSPIHKDFDVGKYPLAVPFRLDASTNVDLPSIHSNYDPSKMTTIIMTGVTALVRATALTMELKGTTYPAENIRDVFREADVVHISNEIPFFTGCPYPKPQPGALVFCSDPKYMDLLLDVGVDVIELTGNHFADFGPEAMYETLEIYRNHNIPYFGGGEDLSDSLKPALLDVNGNKIAFIGCNKPDVGDFPTATDYQPGAAPCDFKYLTSKIHELRENGYVVISTFQWNESYDYKPNPQQVRDFQLMADSGASIVSGSQAHYSQMMEFHNNSFVHYGLGNLFFDQMGDQDWMPPGIRREFFDRYVIYDGELASIELLTAMLEDYSRPRFMNDTERAVFLQEYFSYSGLMQLTPTVTPVPTITLTPMSVPAPVTTASP